MTKRSSKPQRSKAKGARKGAAFERLIAKRLSLWWTDGSRDDVFWRTANSGGRASVRRWQNKNTQGQLGDLAATDPIGQPFIDHIHVELKRGYSNLGPESLLGSSPLVEWFIQAARESREAGAKGWWLIHRRDRKPTLLYMSAGAWRFCHQATGMRPGVGMIFPTCWKEEVAYQELEQALTHVNKDRFHRPRR